MVSYAPGLPPPCTVFVGRSDFVVPVFRPNQVFLLFASKASHYMLMIAPKKSHNSPPISDAPILPNDSCILEGSSDGIVASKTGSFTTTPEDSEGASLVQNEEILHLPGLPADLISQHSASSSSVAIKDVP